MTSRTRISGLITALVALTTATTVRAEDAPRFPWDAPASPAAGAKAAPSAKPAAPKDTPSKPAAPKATAAKASAAKSSAAKASAAKASAAKATAPKEQAPRAPEQAAAEEQPANAKPPSATAKTSPPPKADRAKPEVEAKPVPSTPSGSAGGTSSTAPRSNTDERLQRVEAALGQAGMLDALAAAKADAPDPQHAEQLRAELKKLEQQESSLNAAIAGGVDPAAVAGTLQNIKKRRADLESELQSQTQRAEPPMPVAPKSPLVLRLEALEHKQQQNALELAALSNAAPKTTTAEPSAAEPAPSSDNAAASNPAANSADAPKTSGYDDGFVLRSADGNFSLQPNGFVQVKFAYEAFEGADDRVAFSLPRARAGMKGVVFTPVLKYNFLADFGKGSTQLSYFYGDYTVSKDVFALRVGLFKRPFSRALLNASEKAEFVSSPLTLKAFGEAHDIGLMLHNGTPSLEYAIGVFNGTGSKGNLGGTVQVDPLTGAGSIVGGDLNNVPNRFHPLIVGRVGYNQGDVQGYSEADFDGGPARFAVGAAGQLDMDTDDDKQSFVRGTLDGLVKAHGFSTGAAAIVSSRQAGNEFGARAYDALGFVAQAGYVIAKHVQPVARYTLIAPAEVASTHEVAVGANIYLHKHALKWQNEFNVHLGEVDGASHTDSAVSSQVQLVF